MWGVESNSQIDINVEAKSDLSAEEKTLLNELNTEMDNSEKDIQIINNILSDANSKYESILSKINFQSNTDINITTNEFWTVLDLSNFAPGKSKMGDTQKKTIKDLGESLDKGFGQVLKFTGRTDANPLSYDLWKTEFEKVTWLNADDILKNEWLTKEDLISMYKDKWWAGNYFLWIQRWFVMALESGAYWDTKEETIQAFKDKKFIIDVEWNSVSGGANRWGTVSVESIPEWTDSMISRPYVNVSDKIIDDFMKWWNFSSKDAYDLVKNGDIVFNIRTSKKDIKENDESNIKERKLKMDGSCIINSEKNGTNYGWNVVTDRVDETAEKRNSFKENEMKKLYSDIDSKIASLPTGQKLNIKLVNVVSEEFKQTMDDPKKWWINTIGLLATSKAIQELIKWKYWDKVVVSKDMVTKVGKKTNTYLAYSHD